MNAPTSALPPVTCQYQRSSHRQHRHRHCINIVIISISLIAPSCTPTPYINSNYDFNFINITHQLPRLICYRRCPLTSKGDTSAHQHTGRLFISTAYCHRNSPMPNPANGENSCKRIKPSRVHQRTVNTFPGIPAVYNQRNSPDPNTASTEVATPTIE